MERSEYLRQIAHAHHDEVMTAIALGHVCAKSGENWPHYRSARLLQSLETHVGKTLEPLMARYGLPLPDAESIAAEGAAMAQGLGDWPDMMHILRGLLPDVVKGYDQLAVEAEPGDEAILDYFARHERLLLRLANAEAESQTAQTATLADIERLINTPVQ